MKKYLLSKILLNSGLAVGIAISVFGSDTAHSQTTLPTCQGAVTGTAKVWSPKKSNALRNTRINWRRTVRNSPLLGHDWADWDLARKVQTNCGQTSYCCASKNVAGVTWHRCSATAEPCIPGAPAEEKEPRRAENPTRAAALSVVKSGLRVLNVGQTNRCPRKFALRAQVVATGQTGTLDLILRSGSDVESVTLELSDFDKADGKTLVIEHDFIRSFDRTVNRKYRLEVKGPRAKDAAARRSRSVVVQASCQVSATGGSTFTSSGASGS